jgi:hypothetical protein
MSKRASVERNASYHRAVEISSSLPLPRKSVQAGKQDNDSPLSFDANGTIKVLEQNLQILVCINLATCFAYFVDRQAKLKQRITDSQAYLKKATSPHRGRNTQHA